MSDVLSIIVPVYNEARTVRAVLDRLLAIDLPVAREILVIDDASLDGTGQVLTDAERDGLPITVLRVPVNRGKGHAIRLGIAQARGSIIAIQDADLELDPQQLAALVQPIVDRETAVVFGSRFLLGRPPAPLISVIANQLLTSVTNVLFGATLTDMETCYKVMRVEVARSLVLRADRFDIEPEITAKLLLGGHRVRELPVSFRPRSRAEGKKIGWRDGVRALSVLFSLRWAGNGDAWPKEHRLLLLLVLASLVRMMLAAQGGQLYWPDERLYTQVLDLWQKPGWVDVLQGVIGFQDHLGFAMIALIPAAAQHAIANATSIPVDGLFKVPAALLSQMSVLSIALVYAIARKTGANRTEAFVAALLMTSATSMMYYSRHLLPYDSAMAFALGALWFGIAPRGRMAMIACGALSAIAFIIYNGYWLLVSIVLLIHLIGARASWRGVVRRALLAGLGFLGPPLALMLAQALTGAPLLVSGMRRLAGTVKDGYAPEGFALTWAYLWHAEHWLVVLWIAAAMVVIVDSGPWTSDRRQSALLWLGGAAAIYLGLSVTSALTHTFVVMGRQSRQMVPFLCLAAAPAILRIAEQARSKRMWLAVATSALLVQVGYNMRQPILQRFPRDVNAEIIRKYGPVDYGMSISGPTAAEDHIESRWLLLNAQHLYPARGPAPVPPGTTVAQFPHPLEFIPYQYEGFEPLERQVLRRNDISMRLLEIAAARR